jgi:hypothetical protein
MQDEHPGWKSQAKSQSTFFNDPNCNKQNVGHKETSIEMCKTKQPALKVQWKISRIMHESLKFVRRKI